MGGGAGKGGEGGFELSLAQVGKQEPTLAQVGQRVRAGPGTGGAADFEVGLAQVGQR